MNPNPPDSTPPDVPVDRLRAWKQAGFAATAVIVLTIPLYAVKETRARAGRAATVAVVNEFVGVEACAECHEAATEAWTGSNHDNAMAVADTLSVRGDFNDAEFEHDGITTRFSRRDGKYFVWTEGPDGEMAEFEVTHTFGWEPLQQYLVPFPGGRLQNLTVAWDTERERWFDLYPDDDYPPGDWLHWTGAAMNWNGMCAECHSTNLKKGYDPNAKSFSTTWSEINVSCEACHGPGSRHVEWAEIPEMARPPIDDYGLLVPTSGTTNRHQVELCAPCHSRRTELGDYDHTAIELLDHQIPSVLEEGLYFPDGQILDEVYVYGSFTQSKMYRNDVRCSDCHDVHSLELHAEGNALCLQCHRADTYDAYEHHFHEPLTESGEPNEGTYCVECHMPQRAYMVVDWRADHSIRIPRPDLTLELGTPNACAQAACHGDETDQWNAEHYEEWYGKKRRSHYGTTFAAARRGDPYAADALIRLARDPLYPPIVRATALVLLQNYPGDSTTAVLRLALQDEDALIRYTAAEAATGPDPQAYVDMLAPLLFDPTRAVRGMAASRLAGQPAELFKPYQAEALDEVVAEYISSMEYSLDFAFAGHNLGNLFVALGDPRKAEAYYRDAIEVDDEFLPAKMNLAVLLNAQGRNAEAEQLVREVIEVDPELGEAVYSLALLTAEAGRIEEASELLRRATQLMPTRSRAWFNLGLAEQQLGRLDEAGSAFRTALELEPENLDYLSILADYYARRADLPGLSEIADRLEAAYPTEPITAQVRAVVDQVRASRGG